MDQSRQQADLHAALERARRRWLWSATVNAGGRWAALPALAAALAGAVLAMAGVRGWLPLLIVALSGLCGVAAALVITRRVYALPGRPGAPDWALGLDRALGLNDALVVLLEGPGPFAPALLARVAAGLDPAREKAAVPPRHWAPVVVACMLCLLPLAALAPRDHADTPPDNPSPVARSDRPAIPPPQALPELPPPLPPPPSPAPDGAQGGGTDGGPPGRPQPMPEPRGEGGDAPKPDPKGKPPQEQTGGPGDQVGPPPPMPEAEPEPEIDARHTPITPEAGKGETRQELRRRWLYDPNGTAMPGAQPNVPPMQGRGESPVPRQKVTSTERKTLERLYETLYR
ncbi:MAG: hypothetical protein HS108_11100 [Planctomycetes bacterium]|jgi:hypothetical protein|nr:hypothetical protein [Planctomycetota bacterium]MCL4729738.1 hypothetical protein [Planctomycetota bacterium]